MKWKIFILSVFFLFSLSILPALDYTISPNTYSIQSGDFDNDGDNDIVVGHINPGTLSFCINNGDGLFELIYTLSLTGIAKCYFLKNLDDNPAKDAVIYSRNDITGFVTIIYNGEYQSPYSYNLNININTPIPAMNCGDFDGDSDYDLVFSSSGAGLDNLWGVMYNLGDREFSEPEWFECPSQALNADFEKFECNDLDNNGLDDIIAFSFADTYIYYFSEDGFTVDSLDYQVTSSGMTSADFDNDEDYDIVITHWPIMTLDNFKIYENLGNQDFILHNNYCETLWGNPISCELNNDDLIDIVTVGDEIKKYFNEGNLQFSEVYIQDYPDYGESWVKSSFSDFDCNGTQDVAIIRYGIEENNLTVLYNDGTGNFLEEPQVGISNFEYQISNVKLKNYPNPFNPLTTISYDLPVNISNPVIEIFNIKGEKVREFPIITPSPAHSLSVTWDGTDNYRKPVSSGVYLYRIKADDYVSKTKRMLLIK